MRRVVHPGAWRSLFVGTTATIARIALRATALVAFLVPSAFCRLLDYLKLELSADLPSRSMNHLDFISHLNKMS